MSDIFDILSDLEKAKEELDRNSVETIREYFSKNPVITVSDLLELTDNSDAFQALRNYEAVLVRKG